MRSHYINDNIYFGKENIIKYIQLTAIFVRINGGFVLAILQKNKNEDQKYTPASK